MLRLHLDSGAAVWATDKDVNCPGNVPWPGLEALLLQDSESEGEGDLAAPASC